MSGMWRFSLAIAILGLAAVAAQVRAELSAGIAVRNVTPDPLLPVSGGVGPGAPAREKQGELTVRAIVFRDGKTKVAIACGDFLGFPSILGNKVRTLVPGIPPENILIGATHTHSAPDCYGFPNGQGGSDYDAKYVEHVCSEMAAAIRSADENAQPVQLKIATGKAEGKIAYNYYAEQLYDPRCHVIQTIGRDGQPLATLVNYAIHPEVIGSRRGICSPDMVGPLCERIAEKGGGTAIYMNSAQGGMVTADNRQPAGGEANDWAECQRIGNLLADEALRIVAAAPPQASPGLYCTARRVRFPIDSPEMRQLIAVLPGGREMAPEGDAVTTQLNLINLGNAQIVTIPGEALPNIGYYLKRKMRGEHNLLFGLTNDAFGYILTKEDFGSFERYSYVSRTSLGERTGEILVSELLKLVEESPQPTKLAQP
jgi:hypothetical protein